MCSQSTDIAQEHCCFYFSQSRPRTGASFLQPYVTIDTVLQHTAVINLFFLADCLSHWLSAAPTLVLLSEVTVRFFFPAFFNKNLFASIVLKFSFHSVVRPYAAALPSVWLLVAISVLSVQEVSETSRNPYFSCSRKSLEGLLLRMLRSRVFGVLIFLGCET